MNKLSSAVIDFTRHRPAAAAMRSAASGANCHRRQAGALSCKWRRDPVTGRLYCTWTSEKGAREPQPPSRLAFAA